MMSLDEAAFDGVGWAKVPDANQKPNAKTPAIAEIFLLKSSF
jgi:hypothetical protein